MEAYLLTDGSLRVLARSEDRTLAIVSAPALVGELAVVAGRPRSATVVADTPCVVLAIPADALRLAMVANPLFAAGMAERTDLIAADAFLKRRSPMRDLPGEVVASLARQLRPRILQPDQLVQGRDGDLYLVRRGAVRDERTGAVAGPGEFVRRRADDRYSAVGETWLYELRASDVGAESARHERRLRAARAALREDVRLRHAPGARIVSREGDDAIVYDGRNRCAVDVRAAEALLSLDGRPLGALLPPDAEEREAVLRGIAALLVAGIASVQVRGLARLLRRAAPSF